ncbi:MAG: ABC transporter substrate-binding protein [Opitutales bacterium]
MAVLTGCDSPPSTYEVIKAKELKSGASNHDAHLAALAPYREEILQKLPAEKYATNDLIIPPAQAFRVPEWTEWADLKIKIHLPRTQEMFGPWIVAQVSGYFEMAGLRVKIIPSEPSEDYYATLQHEIVDAFIEPTGTRLIQAVANGMDMTAVQSLYQKNPNVITTIDTATPTDQISNATFTPEIFSQQIVGIDSNHTYFAGVTRDRWGVEPLNVRYVGFRVPNPFFIFENRVIFCETEIGATSAFFEIRKVRNWVHIPVDDYLSPQANWLTVVNNSLLNENPDVIKRYNWALFRAILDFFERPDEIKLTIRDAIEQKRHPSYIKLAWEARIPYIKGDGQKPLLSINKDALNWNAATLLQQGLLEVNETNE